MQQRDAIDFGKANVAKLFVQLFVPTVLGLLFSALLNLADGIFVGRGVSSDALAAVNIAAPVFMICTGLSLMFGSGVSVVAAIHLSHGNVKAADINVTQAITLSMTLMLIASIVVMLFPALTAQLFGGSPRLVPLSVEYLTYVTPGMVFSVLLIVGLFVLRLDGAPNYAMAAEILASLLNIGLDYLMVFPLQMGIKGAAIATTISQVVGATLVAIYLWRFSDKLHLYHPKFTRTSLRLTARNAGYMIKLGFPNLLGEMAICCTMIVGNYSFISRLHEDGVAAFSVACYLLPLIFMFGSAIAQSSLPIVSYNYGLGHHHRVVLTLRISVVAAIVCGLATSATGILLSQPIIDLFLDGSPAACTIAETGFPYYAFGFVFIGLNLVLIGYCQSVKRSCEATIYMLLRGFVFVIPCFILLPRLLGDKGLWLAVPVAEGLTLVTILLTFARRPHSLV